MHLSDGFYSCRVCNYLRIRLLARICNNNEIHVTSLSMLRCRCYFYYLDRLRERYEQLMMEQSGRQTRKTSLTRTQLETVRKWKKNTIDRLMTSNSRRESWVFTADRLSKGSFSQWSDIFASITDTHKEILVSWTFKFKFIDRFITQIIFQVR